MALTDKLTAIADGFRESRGTTDKLSLDEMATLASVPLGGELPEEAFNMTGNCNYRFMNGGWDWFIEEYGSRIKTEKITDAMYMFGNYTLEEIPFELNFYSGDMQWTFNSARNLKSLPKINYTVNENGGSYKMRSLQNCFYSCELLREIDLSWIPFEELHKSSNNNTALGNLFYNCYSLRSIPEEILKQLYVTKTTSYQYSQEIPYGCFQYCYSLDELRGLYPFPCEIYTSNVFYSAISNCCRLKEFIFATQDDGTPYIRNWKNQTIDLTSNIGYVVSKSYKGYVFNYNSGLSEDKAITDDASYALYKDDPEATAIGIAYSRYNHDSAVNTINSLPDCSGGSNNTIKFKGAAGSSTDGGAINTLTEEEIAVATAKGWTVTLS